MRHRVVMLLVSMAAAAGGIVGCDDGEPVADPASTPAVTGELIALPTPRHDGPASLEETLASRRSVREYTSRPLSRAEMSQLLWAAQGVTGDGGGRTAPSAGGLYPLEVYVATADGVDHYHPREHALEPLISSDLREPLARAGLGQEALHRAPAIFVIAGVYARTAAKYGDRAERYVELEAGHCAQNLLLQTVALDLAAVPVGAFRDDDVAALLGLPADHAPLYLIPVGHPPGS
jgi:SagB-type dehydrogenase family enzyme